jgi:hypothetical protein
MKSLLFFLLTIVHLNVSAGEISNIFGVGVFETVWGNTLKDVKKTFPNGKIEKHGKMVQFVIKDGRSIFGLTRDDKALIRFAFDTESRLNAVVVYFDAEHYGSLVGKVVTLFGEYNQKKPYIKWAKDGDITLSLSGFNTDVMFTIEYSGLSKPDFSKEQLGF